jgi:hypothetical protein
MTLAVTAARAPASGLEDLVASLSSETEECNFLSSLCRAARVSSARAEGTPSNADVLSTRQALVADARTRDAIDAAHFIERKRGRRLACFDVEPCAGIVPKARPQAASKKGRAAAGSPAPATR